MNAHGAVRHLAISICALLAAALGSVATIPSSSDPEVRVAGAPVVAVEPAPPEPPTTTSTTPPTTTPPTTISGPKPAPAVARAARVTPPPPPPPPPPAPAPPSAGATTAERCAEALRWAGDHGLSLPAGWGYRCPDPALGGNGASHWGVACINMPVYCPTTAYVAINMGLIGASDAALHHVVAHEICHAIEFATIGRTTEPSADACAAAHGAPRP